MIAAPTSSRGADVVLCGPVFPYNVTSRRMDGATDDRDADDVLIQFEPSHIDCIAGGRKSRPWTTEEAALYLAENLLFAGLRPPMRPWRLLRPSARVRVVV